MKKKYIALLITAGIVASALIGTTLATEYKESFTNVQKISEKTLGVGLNPVEADFEVAPGGDALVSYNIVNDGGEQAENGSYDIYAKVSLYYGWSQDEEALANFGEILPEEENYLSLYVQTDEQNGEAVYTEIPKIASYKEQMLLANGWIVAYCDNEQAVFYYTKPLEKDEVSTDFLSKIGFSSEMDNRYAKAELLIETEVTAVQVNSGKDAIAAEWGVFPVFALDANGNETDVIAMISEER